MSDKYSSESVAKNQAEQEARYKAALQKFLDECNDIDENTFYSIAEPKWWLEMTDVVRSISLIRHNYNKDAA